MIYDNILQTIGNTPIVRLNRMAPDHVEMFVKVESFNPLASVKDRLASPTRNNRVTSTLTRGGINVVIVTAATGPDTDVRVTPLE